MAWRFLGPDVSQTAIRGVHPITSLGWRAARRTAHVADPLFSGGCFLNALSPIVASFAVPRVASLLTLRAVSKSPIDANENGHENRNNRCY